MIFLLSLATLHAQAADRYPLTREQSQVIQQLARYSRPHMISEVADLSCLGPAKGVSGAIRALGQTSAQEKASAEKVIRNLRLAMGANARLLSNVGFSFVNVLPLRSDGGCLPGHQYADGGRTLTFARRCPANSRQGAMRLPTDQATIVHELGHLVANRGGLYPQYNASVRRACRVSGYCTHSSAGRVHRSRNEEFAEVFAAYMVAPLRLESECPAAYKFMKERVFLGQAVACGKRVHTGTVALSSPFDLPACSN